MKCLVNCRNDQASRRFNNGENLNTACWLPLFAFSPIFKSGLPVMAYLKDLLCCQFIAYRTPLNWLFQERNWHCLFACFMTPVAAYVLLTRYVTHQSTFNMQLKPISSEQVLRLNDMDYLQLCEKRLCAVTQLKRYIEWKFLFKTLTVNVMRSEVFLHDNEKTLYTKYFLQKSTIEESGIYQVIAWNPISDMIKTGLKSSRKACFQYRIYIILGEAFDPEDEL